jgi:IS30 family transposase
MTQIPTNRTARGGTGHYHGRWRWWYAAICDYRIRHPGCSTGDIAAHLGKHVNTVSAIVSTDLYREYEAQRMQEFRNQSDNELRMKLTGIATQTLDIVQAQLNKKHDQIPLKIAAELMESTLDRLGFAPQPMTTQVVVNNQQLVLPNAVSAAALEEARSALRAVEQRRLSEPIHEVEAELVVPSPESLEGLPDADAPD